MATHKSAEKRARQTVRKNTVNSARRSKVRTAEKKLIKAISALDMASIPKLLKEYTSEATRAVSKGVFKKQTISRKIGRLATRAHKSASAPKQATK